jgi:hypothetical protein
LARPTGQAGSATAVDRRLARPTGQAGSATAVDRHLARPMSQLAQLERLVRGAIRTR